MNFILLQVSYRGPERIRTAVEAFAELSLATRPQDLFLTGCENKIFLIKAKIGLMFHRTFHKSMQMQKQLY